MKDEQRIIDAHHEHFGEFMSGHHEPHYIVFFGDDLVDESVTGESRLGLGFSYNRDFRWAYIGTEDSDNVRVERIDAEFPLAVFLAREDDYELTRVSQDRRFEQGVGNTQGES